MREVPPFIIAAVLALWLQTTSVFFLIPSEYKPDLILILVCRTSLRSPFVLSAALSFGAGVAVDLLSSHPLGLFALIYCVVSISCGYMNSLFQMDTPLSRAATVLASALASAGMVLLMRMIAGPLDFGWACMVRITLKSLITATSCFVAFPLLDRFWNAFGNLIGSR